MDDQLKILQKMDAPEALADLDDQIFAALAEGQRESAAMRHMMVFAAFLSLSVGVVAGGVMPRPAVAAGPISALVPASPLAHVGLGEVR